MSNGTKIAIGLILVLGLAVAYFVAPWSDRTDTVICKAMYGRARTAADTAVVDGSIAVKERGRGLAVPTPTCGELLHRGAGAVSPVRADSAT